MSPNPFPAPLVGASFVVALATFSFAPSFPPSRVAPSERREDPGCRVEASSAVDAGRYLVRVAGCNDCHTPGYAQLGPAVPEQDWLTGVPVGWRGPWGTTYATNLRLFAHETPEDVWLSICRDRAAFPPMPWDSLHAMSESDQRAIHAYLRHLGPAGERMPDRLDPGVEPETPFMLLDPGEVGFRRVYAEAPVARVAREASAEAAGSFEVMGLAVRVRVPSEDTRDAVSLVEETLRSGTAIGPLALRHHDGVLDVLAGTVEVRLGSETCAAGAGDRVVVPRGTVHSIRNVGTDDARLLRITSPGGYDEFLRELASTAPGDEAGRRALRDTYGVEVFVP